MRKFRKQGASALVVAASMALVLTTGGVASATVRSGNYKSCTSSTTPYVAVSAQTASSPLYSNGLYIRLGYQVGGTWFNRFYTGSATQTFKYRALNSPYRSVDRWTVEAETIGDGGATCSSSRG